MVRHMFIDVLSRVRYTVQLDQPSTRLQVLKGNTTTVLAWRQSSKALVHANPLMDSPPSHAMEHISFSHW